MKPPGGLFTKENIIWALDECIKDELSVVREVSFHGVYIQLRWYEWDDDVKRYIECIEMVRPPKNINEPRKPIITITRSRG